MSNPRIIEPSDYRYIIITGYYSKIFYSSKVETVCVGVRYREFEDEMNIMC